MAKKEATLWLRIKQKGAATLKTFRKQLNGITDVAKKVALVLGVATAAFVKLAQRGQEFTSVQRAFRNLANEQGKDADRMIQSMRELSAGTVSDMELMKKANNALLLGLPVERFGDMLTIARSSAKATGQSMEFMLNSIVTGLGRGSKLMLDNLGIIIDATAAQKEYLKNLERTTESLSEAERKQIFINKALEIGLENAKKAGTGVADMNDKYKALQVTLVNTADRMGVLLGPAFELLVESTSRAVTAINKFTQSREFEIWAQKFALGISIANRSLDFFMESLGEVGGTIGKVFSAVISGDLKKIPNILAEYAKESDAINKRLTRGIEDDFDLVLKRISERKKQANEADLNNNKAHLDAKQEQEMTAMDESFLAKSEKELAQAEEKFIQDQMIKDREFQALLEDMDRRILAEQDQELKLELIRKKVDAVKAARMKAERKNMLDQNKKIILEEQKKSLALMRMQQTVATEAKSLADNLVALTEGKNKALVALAKVAAIAQIIINTEIAKTNASATMAGSPVMLGIMTGILEANRIAAIALVAKQGLAEGGIVPATPGGQMFQLGEGGRSEAVIPLDDGAGTPGLGGGNTYIFNGPMMGNKEEAREFAIMIDEELNDLQQDNESVAFDGTP